MIDIKCDSPENIYQLSKLCTELPIFERVHEECYVALVNLAQIPFAGGVVLDKLVNSAFSLFKAISVNQVALER